MALKSTYTSEEKGAEIEEALDALDTLVDRVKVLYEQYFMGIQRQPPTHLHTTLERQLRELQQEQIRNTALRYRFVTLQQKHGAYNSYWKRTLREIEGGRYLRNLSRVRAKAAKNGDEIPEEILAKMPKRMRDAIARDRELALAKGQREGTVAEEAAAAAAATAAAEAMAAAEEPRRSKRDTGSPPAMVVSAPPPREHVEEVRADEAKTAPRPRTPTPRNQRHFLDDVLGDDDIDAALAALADEAAVKIERRRPTIEPPLGSRAAEPAPPAATATGAPPAPGAAPGRMPIGRVPASVPKVVPPIKIVPPGTHTPPTGVPVRAPTPALGLPVTMPTRAGTPALGVPVPPRAATPAAGVPVAAQGPVEPGEAPPPPPPSAAAPRALTPAAGVPVQMPPPRGLTPALGVPVQKPPPRGLTPALGVPVVPPHAGIHSVPPISNVQAAISMREIAAAMAASPPPLPRAGTPALGVPIASPPSPSGASAVPATIPASGVSVSIPIGASSGATAVPSASGAHAAPSSGVRPAVSRPSVSRPDSSSGSGIPGMSESDTRALYAKYVKARTLVGEATEPMTYERMVKTLSSQAPKILRDHHSTGVEFNVVVRDNKVVLKAKPK